MRKELLSIIIDKRMKCCECGARPVLRQVGTKGYCKTHTSEAFAAAAVQGRISGRWRIEERC